MDAPMDVARSPAEASGVDAMAPDAVVPCDEGDAATVGFDPWYTLPIALGDAGATVTFGVASNIAVVAPTAQSLALFTIDGSGNLLTSAAQAPFNAAAWTAWTILASSGTVSSGTPVTALQRAPGEVDIYAVAADGAIVMLPGVLAVQPDAAPAAWVPVGSGAPGFAAQTVAAVASGASSVQVVAIGNDGNVWECDGDGTPAGFSAWIGLSANAQLPWLGAVTAITHGSPPGVLDAFAVGGQDFRIYDAKLDEGDDAGWEPWSPIGDPITTFPKGSVASASRLSVQIDIFVVGNDDGVWSNLRNDDEFGGVWYGWYSLGGQVATGAQITALAQTSPSRIDVFVPAASGEIVSDWWTPTTGWSQWQPLSAGCGRSPMDARQAEALYDGVGGTEVFAIDSNGVAWGAQRLVFP